MDYKFEFDDLSYSGIVGIIDKNEATAKEYLIENFYQIQQSKTEVERLKALLYNEETYLKRLEESVNMVFQHMSFQKPMALILEKDNSKEIIVISETNITLEKNVL